MKILVTSGATREPIDRVRFITNMSSGRTGAAIADALSNLNHQVTYLHGEGAAKPFQKVTQIEFKDFNDLDKKIKTSMATENFEVVIHSAAVSDYSVEKVITNGESHEVKDLGKLKSDTSLEIKLKSNYKILNRIKSYVSTGEPLVVGFKLTDSIDSVFQEKAIEKLFSEGCVDLVVHNDLKEIESQPEHKFHLYNIFQKIGTYNGADALAVKLNELISEVV